MALFSCQTDPDDPYEAAEWYGLNSYVFCDGNATKYDDALGFQLLGQAFESYMYSIPVLLTEFGCLSKTFRAQGGYQAQRNFLQAKWLLEQPYMREVFSGGFAFEYSMEMEYAKSDSPYPFTRLGGQSYGVGHLANETCDDIEQQCQYVPHPSFYNLKEAYSTANISNTVTKDTFVPSPNRLQHSQCPDHFPPLQKFKWSPDDTDNLACPKKGSASQFTCPADYNMLFIKSKSKTSGLQVHRSNYFWGTLYTVVLLAVATASFLYVRRRSKKPVPEILTLRPYSEDDSLSDESNGLLSMKDYRSTGGAGMYQALSSDSSSVDLPSRAKP